MWIFNEAIRPLDTLLFPYHNLSVETTEIAQKFTKAGWDEKAAYEIAEAINGNAAIKAEFEAFKLQLDKKISQDDFKNKLDEIKEEIKRDLKDFIDTKLTAQREIIEANVGKQLIEQKADTDRQFAKVDTQLAEMKAEFAEIKAKMETNQKWLMGLGIMLLGAILATNLPDLLKALG